MSDTNRYFAIQVVDDQTGRGVPLVELRTVNNVRYYTDSNGIAAIDEPGLEGQEVFFFVRSDGYEYPADGFGYHGLRLSYRAGSSAQVKIHRVNLAERLYRVTGGGIYRDSVLAGHAVPLRNPLLDGQVFGQDSVLNARYRGRIFWIWGDTDRPSYPLGNFSSTAATSGLPGAGGLDPSAGVDLDYFVGKDGFVKGVAPLPGPGPCWLGALVVLPENGQDRLFATYSKVNQDMSAHERGLVRFDDGKQVFEKVEQFDLHAPLYPMGNPFRVTENGVDYLYFGTPYPLVRVRATVEAYQDLSQYEAFTCLKAPESPPAPNAGGTTGPPAPNPGGGGLAASNTGGDGDAGGRNRSRDRDFVVDRDAQGRLQYGWKRNTPPVGPAEQDKLIKAGKMTRDEALLQLQDVETGMPIFAHGGSVYWNEYRQRWILIAVQAGGTSYLGEVWYAEAPTPLGPWIYARKIVTHDRYSFYNPKQDSFFDQDGGRLIYFEGTYADTFSGNPTPTPRYNYNQVMYRLDLSDPRLTLPVPVTDLPWKTLLPPEDACFCAPDRPGNGLVPVYWRKDAAGQGMLTATGTGTPGEKPLFFALPAGMKDAPATTVPLYEWVRKTDGARLYTANLQPAPAGFERTQAPLCRVWKNPCRVNLDDYSTRLDHTLQ